MTWTQYKFAINSLMVAIILVSIATISGCHRGYYRRQADAEVKRLIAEKTYDPRWNSIKGDIQIDSQSRMHDPFSQDHPPIPTDDPASHQLMKRVDGKPGYPHWHSNGDISEVENPLWKSYLPIDERGQVRLSLEKAYQLAILHSPDLQSQYETLYESALDVSLERFGFDSQLFAGFNSFFTTQGRLAPGGSQSSLSGALGANGEGIQLERLGVTGATFVAGLANTILFNFAGNNTQTANTILDFSLVQPLLQNAGREQILEALTQSERTLLANVRQLERFKRGFYLQVAIGRAPGAGPNLAGGFLGAPASGGINAGGFLGLLEQQQQIRNQEFNIRQLETVLIQFQEYHKSGLLDAVQLKLFETSFYLEQRTLLDAKTAYETALDEFKSVLGLPPDLDVVIDDDFLERFELISDEINDRLIAIGDLRTEVGSQLSEIDSVIVDYEDPDFEWPADLEQRLVELQSVIEAAQETIKAIRDEDFAQLNQDFERLDQKRSSRTEYLQKLTDDVAEGRIISSISSELFEPSTITDPAKLRELLAKADALGDDDADLEPPSISARLDLLEKGLEETQNLLKGFPQARKTLTGKALYDYLVLNFQQAIPGQLSELNNISLDLSLLQAQARANSIEIINSDIDSQQAIGIARCMRRDWMNARASLVDQYRNIEFVADQLEAGVDLVFQGSIGNVGNNPFRIRTETGELQAGLQFDSPIVRQAERNAYRTALIDYQQSKRSFYQFEDSVKGDLRELVRNLGRNRVRFELDRRSVQVQIENVEINRLELDRPITASNRSLGTTTARNLTDAIIGLNDAQNSYLSTWVQYEVLRRNLDFDMGTMQLDELDRWIDPGPIDDQIGFRALAMMGVQPDCRFCQDIGAAEEASVHDMPVESEIQDSNSPATNAEVGELEAPEESDLLEPSPKPKLQPPAPSIKDLKPPVASAVELNESLQSKLAPLQPSGLDLEVVSEVSPSKAPAPTIYTHVMSSSAPVEKRFQQIRFQPIELPTAQPIAEPLPRVASAAQPPVSKTLEHPTEESDAQTVQLDSISQLSFKPIPPIDEEISLDAADGWPLSSKVRQFSIDLPVDSQSGFSRQKKIASFETPQPERFFHTLLPMHAAADSALTPPMAEEQQVQIVVPAALPAPKILRSNINKLGNETGELPGSLVPKNSSFGGLFNRFQTK